MRRLILIIAAALTALLLCSCESIGEVQRRIVVHAIGIDPHEKGYEVSYQVFSGSESSDSGPVDASESTVITLLAQGRTLYETEESLRLQTGKYVFLGDTELIVISEDLKNEDMLGFLQYFRKSDVYLGVNVVYCRGSAKDAIGKKLEQGSATAILLRGVVERAIEGSRASSARIIEISNALTADNEAIAVPILSLEKGEETAEDSSVSDLTIGVFGSILISQDGKPMELDENEVMGMRLLRADATEMSIEIETSGGIASVDIDELKIKRKVSIENGAPRIKVNISGRYEVKYTPPDISDTEIRLAAEKQLLWLCEKGYSASTESGQDLFKIEKLLLKYETEYASAQNGDFSEAIRSSVYDVFVKLSKY